MPFATDGRLHAKAAVNKLSKVYNKPDLGLMAFSVLNKLHPIKLGRLTLPKLREKADAIAPASLFRLDRLRSNWHKLLLGKV